MGAAKNITIALLIGAGVVVGLLTGIWIIILPLGLIAGLIGFGRRR